MPDWQTRSRFTLKCRRVRLQFPGNTVQTNATLQYVKSAFLKMSSSSRGHHGADGSPPHAHLHFIDAAAFPPPFDRLSHKLNSAPQQLDAPKHGVLQTHLDSCFFFLLQKRCPRWPALVLHGCGCPAWTVLCRGKPLWCLAQLLPVAV